MAISGDKQVSVFIITYNHEKFIGQCIDSIVSQQTNFDFELIIGEDKSKDNTRAICEAYAAKYPAIIKLLPSDRNFGIIGNLDRTLQACHCKYIASCEGDDYWTDPRKLQKQFDLLESRPDLALCFSGAETIDEAGNTKDGIFPIPDKEVFSISDIILADRCFIPTATLFFRNVLPKPLPTFSHKIVSGDIMMHLLLTATGNAKAIPGHTAVYRWHDGGITKTDQHKKEGDRQEFMLYEYANEYLGYKYDKIFRERLLKMSKMKLVHGSRDIKGTARLKYVLKNVPDYFKYSKGINIKEIVYYTTLLFFPSLLRLKK